MREIKYIILHSEDGIKSHYLVTDGSIIQSHSESEILPHCNSESGTYIHQLARDSNSIGVNIDPKHDSEILFDERIINLICELVSKYHIPTSNILRQYDVTRKSDPSLLIDRSIWMKFINRIKKNLRGH